MTGPTTTASGSSTRAARRWASEATLLIIERDLADGLQEAALSDLNMLVGPGGRERTRAEYASLLASAGLRLVEAWPSARGLHVFEAEVVKGRRTPR